LQIIRPPDQKIEKIKFIEVGNFEFVRGEINSTMFFEPESKIRFNGYKKLLKPSITKFFSKKKKLTPIVDLIRATLVHELSIHSPYKIFYETDNKTGFSGIIPNTDNVAILSGKIKYFEKRIESKENLSYFTNVKNRGVSLEQSILARTISMGAESSGIGFKVPTPYVEQFAAVEVEFSLLKKSDRSNIIKKQILSSYYAKKWGGDPQSSHLPIKTKASIIEKFQKDEEIYKPILSRIDQAGLSFTNPTEYFARGFNLKHNSQVPKNSLEIKIRLGRQVAKKYVKLISPYNEESESILKDGDKIATTLIRGNAFQEAISYLQGLNHLDPEDEYNLGLAYEAIGKAKQANIYYKNAMKKDPSENLYKKAVKRTKN